MSSPRNLLKKIIKGRGKTNKTNYLENDDNNFEETIKHKKKHINIREKHINRREKYIDRKIRLIPILRSIHSKVRKFAKFLDSERCEGMQFL